MIHRCFLSQKQYFKRYIAFYFLLFPQIIIFAQYNIIPAPVSLVSDKDSFTISSTTVINVSNDNNVFRSATLFSDLIFSSTGCRLKVQKNLPRRKAINLQLINDPLIPAEGYRLEVNPSTVNIKATSSAGIFYGLQTLLQLLPPQIEAKTEQGKKWNIPAVSILDYPRFKWRGLMLDVSRHFFTVDEIKRLIDEMAKYKFNLFHWHLTDDQGWRIEIKGLPKLTQVGAWRVQRTGLWWERECAHEGEKATYGGFYTQNQIMEVVEYGTDRHINILPEIDVPGHSLAAIASYPYLSCTEKQYAVNPGCRFYGIDDNALCVGKEKTFDFLEKVFAEVAALFPYKYIHIGGDECYKGFWKECQACQKRKTEMNLKNEEELQSYFIKRIEKILLAKNKELIGWDEILEGGLAPNATVMSWQGMKGGITAARASHHVVMSPSSHTYLDFYQGDPVIEPPTYRSLRLKKVYEFDPVPQEIDSTFILGGQGNLWTESVPTFRHAEYMYWPRSMALSEVLWTHPKNKNWSDFIRRIENHLIRLSYADINYATSFYDAIVIPQKNEKSDLTLQIDTEIEDLEIHYTFDNTYPDLYSPLYKKGEKLVVPADADHLRVITYRNNKVVGKMITFLLSDLAKQAKANFKT